MIYIYIYAYDVDIHVDIDVDAYYVDDSYMHMLHVDIINVDRHVGIHVDTNSQKCI